MRSVNPSRFAMVPRPEVQRSAFDVSHAHKTTFDAGWLVPVLCLEMMPGDQARIKLNALARLTVPITPVMDNLTLESFFFFVPMRLVWDNWERFMGAQDTAALGTTEYLVPVVPAWSVNDVTAIGSLFDYFGVLNRGVLGTRVNVSALPFRAYMRIWNEWFRDQDLQDPVYSPTDDGPDNDAAYTVQVRGKQHDYFTSARPWPAKPAAVTGTGSSGLNPFEPGGGFALPRGQVPVAGLGVATGTGSAVPGSTINESGGRTRSYANAFASGSTSYFLETDLTLAGAATAFPNLRVLINDIRTANQIQLLMERNARGGTRYTEIIQNHFGVRSPDMRLQRPEYIGGGRTFVNVSAVAQTSASDLTGSTTVLGELAGIGTAVVQGHEASTAVTEHGYIIGLVSARPDLAYQQGINRMWFKRSRYDFPWPSLMHLGEQAIQSREIYADGGAGDGNTFGYQERWSEYRQHPNRISGRFRSDAPQTLDIWHFGERFTVRPTLGTNFVRVNPVPVDRVLQVGGQDFEQFLCDMLFDIRLVRPMPMFSVPGLGPRI